MLILEYIVKIFPCLTQLSMEFIMLINVKMPTIVGILKFISMIHTASESLKARKVYFLAFLWAVEIAYSDELSVKIVLYNL